MGGAPVGDAAMGAGAVGVKTPHGASNAALISSVALPVGLALGGAGIYFTCCRSQPTTDFGPDVDDTEYQDSDFGESDSYK